MADVSNLSPGQIISFSLATKLISGNFQNATLLAIVTYDVAVDKEDVDAIHANIYSSLPSTTPKSARDYNYLYVKLYDGTKKMIGIPWIMGDITVVDNVVVHTVRIYDLPLNNGSDLITRALQARGITNFNITTGTE